ncbi:hypothetical protein [Massilia sp. Leaf139]|uniref:hypothetical protein n=1 Tax=Massilia sp. Leaf139 TaxID=1736272 RepID=UPI0007011B7F|nr:hypothetical protein [Massilia sp. Leaf139]KQQ93645.1 hypothetical protein ASF77_22440 [Massilia sp. Leaf139]
MMRANDRKVPLAQLLCAVEDVIAARPRGIIEVARELGYSVGAVRARLEQLELEQRAHRRQIAIKGWCGVAYLWYAGPADTAELKLGETLVAQGAPNREEQAMIPFQSTVRTFPAINRRDPLVAALFGPAPARQVAV